MARVRPGVDEVCACLEPSRALMSDDLPTLERPRKAISGAPKVLAAEGKWAASVAESRKTGVSRIAPV